MTERQVWVEGRSDLGPQYWITEELVSHLEASGFADRAATLFAPPNGSIAERLAQGLGWLARGRQARDRPERMLFFFTAIEALLSDGDKASPVVDRIARDAATILIPDFTERHALARDIKKWYGIRSELVHGGRRNVSSSEADRVQALAEILYISVLEKVDLTTKADTFRADVVQAGYGASWPPQR